MDRIAHYNILEKIGVGGMGEVYRARDTKLGRTVAIKLLPASLAGDRQRRERFLREARAVAAISHPNIATLFEVGEEGERLFLVFEFVPGQTLKAAIGGRPMNTRRALDLAIQLADAVADAHAAFVLHRDLKPDNIVITPTGRAKILDFGLATWTRGGAARAAATQDDARSAESGVVMGTLAYMAPEQASGGEVDERSDIFSLAIVLFEMFTGRHPFASVGDNLSVVTSIRRDPAPAPTTVHRSLPPELDAILGRALAKSPDERYPSAAQLGADLRALAAMLDVRRGATEPAAVVVPVAMRRSPSWGWIATSVLVLAVGSAAWISRDALGRIWRRYAQPPPEPILAVLPLEVSDPSSTYFADGLADDLITRLGQTPGLKVLGRSATRAYRGSSPATIARELRAHVVLTGSVRREGGDLRVTLGLIDPKDGVQIWSRQFDRRLENVFALQTEMTESVARALRVTLAPSAARARTASRLVDARAYDLYLKAREASARRDRQRAVELYEQAVAVDANLAEAHAGLAEAVYLDAIGGGNPYDSRLMERVRQAATNAISIDPDLPPAQLAMGLASARLEDAVGHLTRAIAIDPTYAEGFHQLGDQILAIHPARAVTLYRKALELDARMDVNRGDLVAAHLLLGRPDQAAVEARAALAASPGSVTAQGAQAFVRLAQGSADELLALASREAGRARGRGEQPGGLLLLARAQHAAGLTDQALVTLRAAVARTPGFCEGRAVLAGLLFDAGRRAEARQMVSDIIAEATAGPAPPQLARCAATASAAVGDATATASWLTRIAGDEGRLRWWGLEIMGATGDLALRLRLYPWRKVADAPPVRAGHTEIENAYARLRVIVAQKLAGLP